MKEQQTFKLDEYKELGKLEMTKEVVFTLLGAGLFFAIIKTPQNEKMEVKYL